MASVKKLKEGKYRVYVSVKGQRKSKVIEAKTDKKAESIAAVLESKMKETGSINGATKKEKENRFMVDLCDDYLYFLQHAKGKPIKPKTAQKYSDTIKYHIKPFFRGYKVSEVTVDLVDEFIVWMRSPEAKVNKTNKRSYSEATVKDTFTFLKGLLQYAVTRGYILYNPCNMVQAPAVVEKEVEYLDDVQIANMLRALDDETENAWKEAEVKRKRGTIQEFTIQKDLIGALGKQLLVYIALNTAARRGEILALTRDDIDHEEKSIFFCKEVLYTRDNGTYLQHSLKTDKNKKVFISDTLLEMIDKYIVELDKLIQASNGKIPPTNMLFMSLRNTKTETVGGLPFPDPYSEWFKLFMKRNNLPKVSFHKLRHSSISYMINNGVDLFVVAQIAGHSSIEQIKKTYGHVWDKTKKEAANTLGKMFETNK